MLQLGAPDLESVDRHTIAYIHVCVMSYWVWPEFLIWYSASEHADALRITLDDSNRVTRICTFETSYLQRWFPIPRAGGETMECMRQKINQGQISTSELNYPTPATHPSTQPDAPIDSNSH